MRHISPSIVSIYRGWRALVVLPASSLLLLGACSIGPPAQDPPATYDLGLPGAISAANPGIRATLLIPGIVAPAWLDHAGIAYRLGYHDAARHQIYANSRWVAAPGALLTQRLRSRIATISEGVVSGGDGVRADYALRLELEDFSQYFESAEKASVTVVVRAILVRIADRTLRAQRSFAVERPAAPDAAGAVAGLTEASDALIRELVAWTAQNVDAGTQSEESGAK